MKTIFLFILILLSAAAKAQTPSIHISPGIHEDQKGSILKDLENLLTLPVEGQNPKANALFETSYLTTAHLNSWLADRAHHFVEQGFDFMPRLQVLQENFTYPNLVMPTIETATKHSGVTTGAQTMQVRMSNKGASLYWFAKTRNQKLALDLPGYGIATITTPRIGLFMVGEGLFNETILGSKNSMATSLFRMKTYFHEARHTDGNGVSLGFFHVVCPKGHQYEGFSACDKNSNGPYQVATLFLSTTINACSKCSSAEKEALRNVQLDNQLRIVSQSLNEIYIPIKHKKSHADAPEMSLSSTCQALKDQGSDISQLEACKPGFHFNALTPGADEPPLWDPTPESTGDL